MRARHTPSATDRADAPGMMTCARGWVGATIVADALRML